MMRKKGGDEVGKGVYWNLSNGSRIDIELRGKLPGDRRSTYIRLPSSVMLLLGPILGFAYVILLPFIALGTIIFIVGGKILGGIFNILWKSVSFGWRPKTAYLSGKKRKRHKIDSEKESKE